MFAEITGWSLAYFCSSVLALIFLCFVCMGIFRILLIELPQKLSGCKMAYETEEGLMFVCFFFGFLVGVALSVYLYLHITPWLGFYRDDMPGLPRF